MKCHFVVVDVVVVVVGFLGLGRVRCRRGVRAFESKVRHAHVGYRALDFW